MNRTCDSIDRYYLQLRQQFFSGWINDLLSAYQHFLLTDIPVTINVKKTEQFPQNIFRGTLWNTEVLEQKNLEVYTMVNTLVRS